MLEMEFNDEEMEIIVTALDKANWEIRKFDPDFVNNDFALLRDQILINRMVIEGSICVPEYNGEGYNRILLSK